MGTLINVDGSGFFTATRPNHLGCERFRNEFLFEGEQQLQSARLLRIRDLTLALLFGGAIALILLLVGTTPTPAKLGRYFAENSARVAHGRNIVNVILVDFRAIDTMGEITVLATAALGVWALLKIGRRDEENR
jgi:multisubunit Na+/H+ antiporter MnhB subunit